MKTFISCDWGTSSFRLRIVDAVTCAVYKEYKSDDGIAETHRRWKESGGKAAERGVFYRSVLSSALTKLSWTMDSHTPVIISGMASSSVGIEEMPYATMPFTGRAEELNIKIFPADRQIPHPTYLVSGLCTMDEVMRGEETMLLGCSIQDIDRAVLIFPGTHSKHVAVENGVAVNFETFITGEMFNLLVTYSLLSSSVSRGVDDESFLLGVKASSQSTLLNAIFKVRSRHVLGHHETTGNYQFLSGLLIGTELRSVDRTKPAVIVGDNELLTLYEAAMRAIDEEADVRRVNSRDALLRGQQLIALAFAASTG